MSDSPTYDLEKNIKNIEVNTGFIIGLDSVLVRYITDIYENSAELVTLFKNFRKLISGEITHKELNLNQIEYEIYTVFFLQQLFKAHAVNQGLIKESPKPDESTMKEMLKALGLEDSDKLDKISKLVNDLIDQQDD